MPTQIQNDLETLSVTESDTEDERVKELKNKKVCFPSHMLISMSILMQQHMPAEKSG